MLDKIEIESKYYEIICRLIYDNNIFSIIKIVFCAFAIYNIEPFFNITGNKKYELLDEILDGIKYGINNNFSQFEYIFECINLLVNAKMIDIKDNLVVIKEVPKYSKVNKILSSKKMSNILLDIEKLNDEALIMEVIQNV